MFKIYVNILFIIDLLGSGGNKGRLLLVGKKGLYLGLLLLIIYIGPRDFELYSDE
jgi:hypothetical protein